MPRGSSVFFLTFALLGISRADITSITVTGVSSTQAIIAYQAPDENACSVEVSESINYTPLVHDVDPLLFAGSNLDKRPGAIYYKTSRTFVAGKRAAEVGLDGRRYSRALQAATQHYFRITCGLDQATGKFVTGNIPLGAGYFDPIPVDRNAPGVTAWPGFYGRNRADTVIDPQTGLKIERGSLPQDAYGQRTGAGVLEAQDTTQGGWVPSNGCSDPAGCFNSSAATLVNSTGNTGAVFISNRDTVSLFQAKSYQQNLSYDWSVLHLTAWCSGTTCGAAADPDRTITVCLTVNRVTCEGPGIDTVLGVTPKTYDLGGTTPMLLDWTLDPSRLNMWEMAPFSGMVTVAQGSKQVTWVSGDVFSIWWTSGSMINIAGQNVAISGSGTSQSLTLASPWAGASGTVAYQASNTGFLIQKKTGSTDAISLSSANFDYGFSVTIQADSSGLQLLNWTCSPVQQDLGGGTMGRLCATSQGLYAVESATGVHRSLGSIAAYVPGQYPATICPESINATVFDAVDPNTMYCLASDTSGRSSIFSLRYYGNFSDIGPTDYGQITYKGQTCNASHSNTPCVDQVNLNPPPNHLEAQLATHPDWGLAPAAFIVIGGRQGKYIGLWGHMGNQNSRGWFMAFDPASGKLAGAAPSFRYWPARWAGIHSWNNIQDPSYIRMPLIDLVTQSTALSGYDTPGLGPFGSKVLDYWDGANWNPGAMPAAAQACPARPADSPIDPSDWPSGNRCVRIQVDGETCDPSPGAFTAGTISSGTGGMITASGNIWKPTYDGLPLIVNGSTYTFHYLTPSSATLTPPPAASFSAQSYVLLIESAINNPKCGNPAAFYLQDAAVRDVLMFTSGPPWAWLRQPTEFMRLLVKNGNDWTLERGYKNLPFQSSWPANMMIWQYQSSCTFADSDLLAEACSALWNFQTDAKGQNTTGTTLLQDPGDVSGHTGAAFGPAFGVDAKPYPFGKAKCAPETDWTGTQLNPCYLVRQGSIPAVVTAAPTLVSSMPAFAGLLGVGVPNTVDTHPTYDQIAAPPAERSWFLDARPMNGGPNMPGTSGSPGVNVSGFLWKFTYAQRGCSTAAECTRQRKLLPTLASINRFPLLDISRPSACSGGRTSPGCSNVIGTGSGDWFKYCVAEHAGECRTDSAAGDLYVNGPISQPFCDYPGIAVSGGGTFDPCIAPSGPYTQSIVQIGFGAPGSTDWTGSLSRVLTHGLSRYRWFTPFWNVRTLDDGSWMFWRADWLDGARSEWMAAKLPPYPQPDGVKRNDFIPVPIPVTPTDSNSASAQVEFGYEENGRPDQFFCTSRQETCVRSTQSGDDYAYAGDKAAPLACANGCTIQVPAISQRVLYYRIRFFDATGKQTAVTASTAVIVP
jgi:hypothetical protein